MKRSVGQMSFLRLHNLIGICSFILPLILLIGTVPFCGIQGSMSACWYTNMRDVFVGSLYLCGGFFIANKGYDQTDNRLFNLCGICFFLIATFPCEQSNTLCSLYIYNITITIQKYHVYIHYITASVLFSTLAIICLTQFVKSSYNQPIDGKRQRNVLYIICGWLIIIGILLLISSRYLFPNWTWSTFAAEIIMLFSFGTAFIVKGTGGKIVNLHDK